MGRLTAMVWFTKTPPRGIEIPRLIMASHEIGHYIAFCAAGVPVTAVELAVEDGFNTVEDPADDQYPDYLVAIAAGAAGEKLWCETFGQDLPEHCRDGSSHAGDRKDFKVYQRHHRDLRGLSWRKAERLARVVLRDNAKRFRQLTERLARDGALKI